MNTKAISVALNQDIERFIHGINGNAVSKQSSKSVDALKSLWSTFQPKITKTVYTEKVLALGDLLAIRQLYKLAAYHCYGHYLQTCYHISSTDIQQKVQGDLFMSTFFSDQNNSAVCTIRALIGYSSSLSFHLISCDPNFQCKTTIEDVVSALKLLQLSMQVGLMNDSYCWLVYNGTVHIHKICRKFMEKGLSSYILDYLIWACVSMESSVPLMTMKYLKWRCQLYVTTCHCLYDLNAYAEAEDFARRGLKKVEELKEIEEMSTSNATPETTFLFKQSIMKLNVMAFKRNVFESRKRQKGVLRSKMKPMLKDICHNHWPRTGVERMLADTFRGRAAQLLAINEALSDSNRRLIQSNLISADNDDSVCDVYQELFFAGLEIISGGGGIKPTIPGKRSKPINKTTADISLMELASAESELISLQSAIRFVQLAYNYENWDTFDALIQPLMKELEVYVDNEILSTSLKILQLFHAMSSANSSRIKKKFVLLKTDDQSGEPTNLSKIYKTSHVNDILKIATIVDGILQHKNLKYYISNYHDILTDTVLFLFSKCKLHFGRVVSSSFDSHKSTYQESLFITWVKILIITQKAMVRFTVVTIDPCVVAEVSLKLSFILVCVANAGTSIPLRSSVLDTVSDGLGDLSTKLSEKSLKTVTLLEQHFLDVTKFMGIDSNALVLLQSNYEMLSGCLREINKARDEMNDVNNNLADESMKHYHNSSKDKEHEERIFPMNVHAVHMELIYQYHYVYMFINKRTGEGGSKKQSKNETLRQSSSKNEESETFRHQDCIPPCVGSNDLSKSIALMCSVVCNKNEADQSENVKAIQSAYDLLQKVSNYEERLMKENTLTYEELQQRIPSPPILERRGNAIMVFKPAPFKPSSGESVSSYSLFLRDAAGYNVKVRLSDTQYKGTGEQYPCSDHLSFTVRGLEPNKRYMAAVGAYNSKGELIGGSIGWSTKPILASNVLSVLLAHGYLIRAAYQSNVWSVAKKTSNILWNHFVKENEKPVSSIKTIENDHKLNPKSLKISSVRRCSSLVHHYFVESIFISVDIVVKEGQLFCDSICCQGVLRNSQIGSLNECEKLITAMQMCAWLNENHLCLQAIVQIYGLLTPVIYWKFPIQPAIEVLAYVFAGLQEVQTIFKNKRHSSITDGLQHMVSCLAYYIAKILVNNKKKSATFNVLDMANKFLTQLVPSDNDAQQCCGNNTNETGAVTGAVTGANISTKKQAHKKNSKKNKPPRPGLSKAATDFTWNGFSAEQRALEMYSTKLLKEGASDNEVDLTGVEDAIVLNAVISKLPTVHAYKEVLKFKRRTQFLESFVGVLLKALNERMHDFILDCTKETNVWLTRRNEIILNKSANNTKGIVIVVSNPEDERLKKFSAGVVEYGKSSPAITEKQESKDDNKVDKSDSFTVSDESTPVSLKGQSKLKSRMVKKFIMIAGSERSEKEAIARLQVILPEVWKKMNRRKKMRSVCYEEFPWRCQMNLVNAECYFNICLDKFRLVCKQLGHPNLKYDDNMMDVNWFTLSSSGSLIVSWVGCMKNEANLQQSISDLGGKTVEHFPHEIHLVPTASRTSVAVRLDKKSSAVPAKHLASDNVGNKQDDSKKLFILNLEHSYIALKRAMVLAHRGFNWVLLQHVCNRLLQSTYTVMMRICLLKNNIDFTKHDMPYTLTKLRRLIYNIFYMAADLLLDMMVESKDYLKQEGCKDTFGNIKDNKGGNSLVFNLSFDDNTFVDYGSIKRVLMFAIEVLYYEGKWEKMCNVITRFSAISKDHFSESLLPILVYGQRLLKKRLDVFKKPKPEIIYDPQTGVPLEVRMEPVIPSPIEVGAHIDPEGYNLYRVPDDGLKYSIAPCDFDTSLNQLNNVIDTKLYSSRLLEHSRFLLMSYLAGKQGVTINDGKVAGETSQVSFVASQIKPPSFDPVDLKMEKFDGLDNLEMYPLPEEQIPVVITSYERTIEILQKAKQRELLAQAMHELGNVMFHANNTRSAYRWWSLSLDSILQTNNAQSTWKKYIDEGEKTILRAKRLVERCGVWGCLLGGVVCTNIVKYILSSNIDASDDLCYLALSFYQSLLCTSLTHPTAYHRYSKYDIALDQMINQVIPGLNLFSDPHRIHCGNLTASILWVVKHQVKRGLYLEVQPLLTLLHYLACVVCKDLSCALEVKLLRVESLCALRDHESAIHHFFHIINGQSLPKPGDVIRAKVKCKVLHFNSQDPLCFEKNYKLLMFLSNLRLNHSPYTNVYGLELVNKIIICQSNILISFAELIYDVPNFNNISKVETSENLDYLLDRTKDLSKETLRVSKSQKFQGQRKKSRDKPSEILSLDAKTMQPDELKGKLIVAAEHILETVLQSIGTVVDTYSKENSSSENLELYVKCHLELARIDNAKFHTISAAHHVYECLNAISTATEDPIDMFVENANKDANLCSKIPGKSDNEIDGDMWLRCRHMLCEYLHHEDNAVGRLAGTLSLVGRIGSFEKLLENVLVECKMFNDSVTACYLRFFKIQVDLKCGKQTAQILKRLEELDKKIDGFWIRSDLMMQLQFEMKVLLADLKALLNPTKVSDALKNYQEIEMFVLDNLIYQGYCCDISTMLPCVPYSNVNLKFLNNLVSVKTRLYRVKAIENTKTEERTSKEHWMKLLQDINSCLTLIEQMSSQNILSKIELTLLKGEIHRLLFEMNSSTVTVCVDIFMEVLKLVRYHTVDLSIIRQCYNEIALVFSHMLKLKEKSFTPEISDVDGSGKRRRPTVPQKTGLKPVLSKQASINKGTHRLCKGAWICIRTAGVIAKAQRKNELIAGESSITSLALGDKAWSCLPSYVLEDLAGSEKAMYRLNNAMKEYTIVFGQSNEVEITWVHLLNYATHLRRNCSYSSLALGQFDQALVRIPLHCHAKALKLSAIMKFLATHLSVFSKECCPILPTEIIMSLVSSLTPTPKIASVIETVLASSVYPKTPEISEENEAGDNSVVFHETSTPNPDSSTKRSTAEKLGDRSDLFYTRNPLQAGDFEMALQWFKPGLCLIDNEKNDLVYMLAAMNSKPISGNSSSMNFSQVATLFHATFSQSECLKLHEELVDLVQVAEAELAMQGHPSRSAVAFVAVTAVQTVARIASSVNQSRKSAKLSSPLKTSNQQKPEKEGELREKMVPIIMNLAEFLRSADEMDNEQIPLFETTLTNLLHLESMFNPSLGNITRVTDAMYTWFVEHFNRISR